MLPYLRRLLLYIRDSYVEYVLTKEDIHELAYRQAHKGGLKRSTFIILGSLFRFAYIVVFAYLTYANFVSLRYNQAFLSLSSAAGECTPVPKIYSFSELSADTYGSWESEDYFHPHEAAYKFSLSHITQTPSQYVTFMSEMRDAVVAMGIEGHTHNLAINLLHWCFWEHDMTSEGKIRQLKFTGMPEHILNLDQVQGTISDVYDDSCLEGITYSGYDIANAHLVIDFDVSEFKKGACADVLVSSS
jgi:hypothetical protein